MKKKKKSFKNLFKVLKIYGCVCIIIGPEDLMLRIDKSTNINPSTAKYFLWYFKLIYEFQYYFAHNVDWL